MSINEQVKQYVKAGFSVFPLPYKSKKPFAGWEWRVLQRRKPTQRELERWFSTSRFNVAIVTGLVSGNLCVLDFDDMGAFSVWQEKAGILSRTANTGNGCHVYVRIADPEHLRNGDFQVDGTHAGQCRFTGGYVVAPPSVHPSGARYHWRVEGRAETVNVSDLHITQGTQKGLAKNLDRSSASQERQGTQHVHQTAGVKHPERYARNAVKQETDRVRSAVAGTRNNALFRSSLKLYRHCETLPESEVFHALVNAAVDNGLSDTEAKSTILKAWNVAHF